MADNILTRKLGPLPGWAWGAIGVGAFLIWKYRQNSTAAAASTSAGTGTASSGYASPPSEPSASLQTPGGFNYSGPASYLTNPSLQGLFSGTSTSPAGAVAVTPGSISGEQLFGSGYNAGTAANGVVTTSGGSYSYLPTMSQVTGLESSGGQVYFQPSQGLFQLAPSNLSGLSAGTPLFSKVS